MLEQLITVFGWSLAMAALVIYGYRLRAQTKVLGQVQTQDAARNPTGNQSPLYREQAFRRRLLWVMALFWCAMSGYFATQSLAEALPLHVCDMGGLLAIFALGWQKRWARSVLYFWAMGLTTQAFITPVNEEPITHVRWWFFWGGHSWVVGAAIYDLVVLRFRPVRKDLIVALSISVGYVLGVMVINEALGVNYGYVGSHGDPPGLVALLGPWPWRVGWMSLIGITFFVVLWLPWAFLAWREQGRVGKRDDQDQVANG